ncbi:MAG: glycosyltransferase family 2 protein [Acidobacteriia bacterium]|nr:glycosyltransferase family 2 protein [Terriglobia bacterium]
MPEVFVKNTGSPAAAARHLAHGGVRPQRDDSQSEGESVLVSVVIPAYQAARYIAQALDSVLTQTYVDFEVLVINDGSPDTDLLEQVLQPYLASIRYFKQENRGPSGARNTGILQARGKYVAFLDSDDVWFPIHLASQMALLQKDPALGLVYGDSVLLKNDVPVDHAFGREPQASEVTFESLLRWNCTVGTSTTVASRQALIDAGLFDEQFMRCEDFDLWLRMAFRGVAMDYSRDATIFHRLTSDGLAADPARMRLARIEVYEKIAAKLPVSDAQEKLIRSMIEKTEAFCQVVLAKKFLQEGEYSRALDAAKRASDVLDDWRLRVAVFGLRRFPRSLRHSHRAYEQMMDLRNRIGWGNSARNLKPLSLEPRPEVRPTEPVL